MTDSATKSLKKFRGSPVNQNLGVKFLSPVLCSVDNLPEHTTEVKLLQLLSECKGVIKIMLFMHPHQVAYVEFDCAANANQMAQFDGYKISEWNP